MPFIVPLGSVNLIANALHNGQVGTGGNGKGSTGVVIDPLAVLRGELIRGTPVNLFTVNVSGDGAKSAFYLRTAVLENYTGKAWVQGSERQRLPCRAASSSPRPPRRLPLPTSQFTATVTVSKLGGTAPVFATPTQLGGTVPKTWLWDPRYGLVSGDVTSGLRFTETVAQPDPSIAALEASVAVRRNTSTLNGPNNSAITDNLSTDKVPSQVTDLVTTITAGKTTPYDKARALSSYFTDPANGFVYSLQTKSGESGNDLVDFLTTGKAGFCQQYAAALGVMLRVAGIPARVVLGYTHPAPDASGKFVVTSDDAHAWVEAYFTGIGWVPFDPTPLTGADAARAVALPWAPHPAAVGGSDESDEKARADAQAAAAAAADTGATTTSNATSTSRDSSRTGAAWLGLAVIVLAVLIAAMVPALIRIRRRRQRLHRAATARTRTVVGRAGRHRARPRARLVRRPDNAPSHRVARRTTAHRPVADGPSRISRSSHLGRRSRARALRSRRGNVVDWAEARGLATRRTRSRGRAGSPAVVGQCPDPMAGPVTAGIAVALGPTQHTVAARLGAVLAKRSRRAERPLWSGFVETAAQSLFHARPDPVLACLRVGLRRTDFAAGLGLAAEHAGGVSAGGDDDDEADHADRYLLGHQPDDDDGESGERAQDADGDPPAAEPVTANRPNVRRELRIFGIEGLLDLIE